MIGGLVETGIFKLKEMLDNVLANRPRRPQIAASQILDLLGYVFEVDFVPHRRQTQPQQAGLFVDGTARSGRQSRHPALV